MTFGKGENVLGIEVTRSGIYGAVCHQKGRQIDVKQLFCLHYTDGFSVEGVAKALETLLDHSHVETCTASAVILSSSLISFRFLDFPFSSHAKIDQVLPLELSSHLPLAYENYVTDYIVLDHLRGDQKALDGMPVLTASVPKAILDICHTLLVTKGLPPKSITAGGILGADRFLTHSMEKNRSRNPFSFEKKRSQSPIPWRSFIVPSRDPLNPQNRSRRNRRKERPTLFVDTHADNITVTLCLHQRISGVRTLPCEIDSSQTCLANLDGINAPHGPLERELMQTITSFSFRHGLDLTLDRCDLQWIPRRNDDLSHSWEPFSNVGDTSIEWSCFDALERIGKKNTEEPDAPSPDISAKWHDAVLVLCPGGKKPLIDFCRAAYRKASFFQTYRMDLMILSLFMVICYTLFCTYLWQKNTLIEKALAKTDQELVEQFQSLFPDEKVIVEPVMQMQVKVNEVKKRVGSGNDRTDGTVPSIVDILYEVSIRIPRTIPMEIHRFLFNEAQVIIAGTTDNFNSVDQIKNRLESVPFFKKVTISNATADKEGQGIKFNYIVDFP